MGLKIIVVIDFELKKGLHCKNVDFFCFLIKKIKKIITKPIAIFSNMFYNNIKVVESG